MKNEADNIRNLLLWLLETFDPTFSLPSGNGSTSEASLKAVSSNHTSPLAAKASIFEVGSDATSTKPALYQKSEGQKSEGQEAEEQGAEDVLPANLSQESSSYPSAVSQSTSSRMTSSSTVPSGAQPPRFSAASTKEPFEGSFSQTAQSFNFGEIHAVQERVQSLIKKRLLLEYENNPPLFPWESEVSEYPAEVADCVPAAAAIASGWRTSLWRDQVSALKVSGMLPEALLNSLFERCQSLAKAPVKQGVRLVRAVESLFPEQSDMLEPIANMVLVPAYRSGRAAQDAVIQELANVAGGYDSALPEQKIALSMLAAQEIMGALTFSLSSDRPYEAKSWVTPGGMLELKATYSEQQLTLAAVLPDGGQMRLCDGDIEKVAMRSQPGNLDLIWANPILGKTYVLEVKLQGESQPLNFAVHVADNPA